MRDMARALTLNGPLGGVARHRAPACRTGEELADRITLTAGDGHVLDAWHAAPDRASGGIVVLHAIYGLTAHMADVCDLYAKSGIAAIAPALYDRSGKDIVFGYDAAGRAGGMAQRETLGEATVLTDVEAALAALRADGPVAVQGFCTGGTWGWIAAARLAADAAVIYYGSDVYQHRGLRPSCPAILHYGDRDVVVPFDEVEAIRDAHPGLEFHLYPGADHAFFNPEQESHDSRAAALAHRRSVAFLEARFGDAGR